MAGHHLTSRGATRPDWPSAPWIMALLAVALVSAPFAATARELSADTTALIYTAYLESVTTCSTPAGVKYHFQVRAVRGNDGATSGDWDYRDFEGLLSERFSRDRFQRGYFYAFHIASPRPETGPLQVYRVERDTAAEQRAVLEYVNYDQHRGYISPLFHNTHILEIIYRRETPLASDTDRQALLFIERIFEPAALDRLADVTPSEEHRGGKRYPGLTIRLLDPDSSDMLLINALRLPVLMGSQATGVRIIYELSPEASCQSHNLIEHAFAVIWRQVLELKPRYSQLTAWDTGVLHRDRQRPSGDRDWQHTSGRSLNYSRGLTGRRASLSQPERDERISDWCRFNITLKEYDLKRYPHGSPPCILFPLQRLVVFRDIESSDPELTAKLETIVEQALAPLAALELELQQTNICTDFQR